MQVERLVIKKGIGSSKLVLLLLSLFFWIFLYLNLESIAGFLVVDVFGLSETEAIGSALSFFIFEVPKVLMLLVLIIFIVGIIRTYFSPEKTRKILGGKSLAAGNISASVLGIVTPFCSCSAIPLFIGFVQAGVPLGVTFSFLIAAPMINEVAVVLLFGLFGWQTALIYIITGLMIAIVSGMVIGILKLDHLVEDWVYNLQQSMIETADVKLQFSERIDAGLQSVKEIVGKIWIYIILGIAVGAGIHGYVPQNFMAGLMGKSAWWSVPVSVLIGVPMYSNAAGIIPIVQALLEKGASLGTVLAFMMSVIGLSLPETIILRKVLKMPLIISFVGIVAVGIIAVGFIFNFVF
jgi:uncharacterized membrane protein YraQ (UPF0718 family)